MSAAQLELPYQSHSDTSIAAAVGFAARAPNARRQVHDLLVALRPEGLTDEEIQGALDMSANTERPRRIELQRAGLVCDSAQRRATRSGAHAVVWIATGRAYALPERRPAKVATR